MRASLLRARDERRRRDALAVFYDQVLSAFIVARCGRIQVAGAVGRVLENEGLAQFSRDVRSRSMRHQRREYEHAARAHRSGEGAVVVLATNPSQLGQMMLECSAQVAAGLHPRTTILDGGVGQRNPAGEVGLRLDEVIAVVLMPREKFGILGLLVYRLVAIEAHVGTEQVAADAGDDRGRGQIANEL